MFKKINFISRYSLLLSFVIWFLTISQIVRIIFLIWQYDEVSFNIFTVLGTVLTGLFLFLITFTALLTYLHFFASDDKDLSGIWTAKLDMTKQSAVTALGCCRT